MDHRLGEGVHPRTSIPSYPLLAPYCDEDLRGYREWRYEDRRRIQEIVAGVYLGPHSQIKFVRELQELGITKTIGVCTRASAGVLQPRVPSGISHGWVLIEDGFLVRGVPELRKLVDAELGAGGKVLVFCEDGNSRSAALVVGYVMETRGWGCSRSVAHVQRRRLSVSIDKGMKHELHGYEAIYLARQQTQGVQSAGGERRRRGSGSSPGGREGRAPFAE